MSFHTRTEKTGEVKSLAENYTGYLCDSSCTPLYYFQIVTRKILFPLSQLVEALSENFFFFFFSWRLIHHLG